MRQVRAMCACIILVLSLCAQLDAQTDAIAGTNTQPKEIFIPPTQVPTSAKPSLAWSEFQKGTIAAANRQFGEAIIAFQEAKQIRYVDFSGALEHIETALALAGTNLTSDSVSDLVYLLALRDYLPSEVETVRASQSDSLLVLATQFQKADASIAFADFLDALVKVIDAFGEDRLKNSIKALKKACVALQYFPEAEAWTGKMYRAAGEDQLAKLELQKSLNHRDALYVPEDWWDIADTLSQVYAEMGDKKSWFALLSSMSSTTRLFAVQTSAYRDSMQRTIKEKGVDSFLQQYRIDEPMAWAAWEKLAAYHLAEQNPESMLFSAASVNAIVTQAIKYIRSSEPLFEYTTLVEMISSIQLNPDLSAFADQADFWRALLIFGESLNAQGYRNRGNEVLATLAAVTRIEPWNNKARAAMSRSRSATLPKYLPLP